MADGFLGRWSQRKAAVREGKALDEPPPPLVQPVPGTGAPAAQKPAGAALAPQRLAASDEPQTAAEPAPPPSLDDVKALTAESDFSAFVARGVSPEVRNAAMKKLFADPHYNVMDRLDIYIDDYSQPDPLPASMLRQMTSAKFLNLFEEKEVEVAQPGPSVSPAAPAVSSDANDPAGNFVAQSMPPAVPFSKPTPATTAEPLTESLPLAQAPDHDHTDLRLQPNHALGPQEPGRGTE